MRLIRNWIFVGLLILIVLEVLTLAPKRLGNSSDQVSERPVSGEVPAPNAATPKVATTSQVLQGVQFFETSAGKKEWELDSQSAQEFREKGNWKLTGVKVKFFGDLGTIYTVTGHEGTVEAPSKNLHIEGHVVTRTSDGYSFESNSLSYVASEKKLKTPERVKIFGPKNEGTFEVTGKGFEADLQKSSMDLFDDVHATKEITNEGSSPLGTKSNDDDSVKTMTIKSEKSHVNGKTSEVHFQDMVQVDIQSVRMTGNEADFLYDKKTKSLTSLLMKGNVRVTDQEHWASSQYAQVLFKKNEFILYGNPRINQNGNELRGQEIRFVKGGKEVRVLKARAQVDDREATGGRPDGFLTRGFSR